MKNYYLVATSSMNPPDAMDPWYDEFKRHWLCPGCGTPRPGFTVVDAYIVTRPPRIALNFVGGLPSVRYAMKEFLVSIGEQVIREYFYLGNLFDSNGRLYPEFATFHCRNKVRLRGDRRSTLRRCDACGALSYFAMGRRYLTPEQLTGEQVYEDAGGLIVSAEICERLRGTAWKKLSIQRLRILEEPLDGYEELLL